MIQTALYSSVFEPFELSCHTPGSSHALNGLRSRPFSISATETKDLYDPDSAVSST